MLLIGKPPAGREISISIRPGRDDANRFDAPYTLLPEIAALTPGGGRVGDLLKGKVREGVGS